MKDSTPEVKQEALVTIALLQNEVQIPKEIFDEVENLTTDKHQITQLLAFWCKARSENKLDPKFKDFLDSFKNNSFGGKIPKKKQKNKEKQIDPPTLDEILDKINMVGYNKLTKFEKECLEKYSKDFGDMQYHEQFYIYSKYSKYIYFF